MTFTCGNTSPATWHTLKLYGISDASATSISLAKKNRRISTTDLTRGTQNSRLIISGVTAADNGGSVACLYLGINRKTVRREARVKVGE